MKKFKLFALSLLFIFIWSCKTDPSKFPSSNIDFSQAEDEVGRYSQNSEQKKIDLFNTKYKNKWFTWSGVIYKVEGNQIFVNCDYYGLEDLIVELQDKNAGYDLQNGSQIKVRFVMKKITKTVKIFEGENGILVR